MAISLADAKALLNTCARSELRDHAFGDREVSWTDDDGHELGFYCNSGRAPHMVYVERYEDGKKVEAAEFHDYSLLKCGKSARIERNDSTGPDTYQDGACMPGLTLAGVRKELTGG